MNPRSIPPQPYTKFLVRPVLRRMRQRLLVLQHLAEVAHIHPGSAGGALDEVIGLSLGLAANALADDLAALGAGVNGQA